MFKQKFCGKFPKGYQVVADKFTGLIGLVKAYDDNDMWQVLPCNYRHIIGYGDILKVQQVDGSWNLIDQKGKLISTLATSKIRVKKNGIFVKDKGDDGWQCINRKLIDC